MLLRQWAAKWNIPLAAIVDLERSLLCGGMPENEMDVASKSEARVQSEVRLEAAEKGVQLFRNNVGALQDKTGRVVRYGLANESAAQNDRVKSSDLIGWRRILVEPRHVGIYIAQFVARETKEAGWKYTGNAHEQAQLKFIQMVVAAGGDACFANKVGTL